MKMNQQDVLLQKKMQKQYYSEFKQKQSTQYNQQTQKLLDEMMRVETVGGGEVMFRTSSWSIGVERSSFPCSRGE